MRKELVEFSISLEPRLFELHLSANSFDENIAAGSVVATLSTTYADVVDSFVYELVSGVGDADNTAFVIVDDQLKFACKPRTLMDCFLKKNLI